MIREKGLPTVWVVSWVIAAAIGVESEARAQGFDVREVAAPESIRAGTNSPRLLLKIAIPGSGGTRSEASGDVPSGPSDHPLLAARSERPLTLSSEVFPEDDPPEVHAEEHAEVTDLTLLNFFTEGWAEPWAHRHRDTPDMALLRVTTNFLERELRMDYVDTRHINGNAKVQRSDFFNALIAYGLNRRLMIEVIGNYQWNHRTGVNVVEGAGAALLSRFQLVETEVSSFAFQLRLSAPNRPIGQTASTLSPSLMGWQDLDAAIGLDRVGLYYSVTLDTLAGPVAPGAKTNGLSYDITLAKTWTDPKTPLLGNFTTFLEGFATTDLNGPAGQHTAISLTPGFRFWFVPENSLTFGVDIPITYPHPYSEIYRITYILNF